MGRVAATARFLLVRGLGGDSGGRGGRRISGRRWLRCAVLFAPFLSPVSVLKSDGQSVLLILLVLLPLVVFPELFQVGLERTNFGFTKQTPLDNTDHWA